MTTNRDPYEPPRWQVEWMASLDRKAAATRPAPKRDRMPLGAFLKHAFVTAFKDAEAVRKANPGAVNGGRPPGITTPDVPTWLYRYWDRHGHLLYVGITDNLDARDRQHRKNSPWYKFSHSRTATRYPSRAAAMRAEAYAIRAEKPVYNVQHNGRNLRK